MNKKNIVKNCYLGILFIIYIFFYSIKNLHAQEIIEQVLSNNQGYEFDFSHEEQTMNIIIPQGSIGADVTLRFSFNPLTANLEVNNGLLRTSLDNLNPELRYFEEHIYELALYTGSTPRTDSFLIPLKLEASYKDTDQDGILDGSNPMIFEQKLKAYYLDSDNTWKLVEDQEQDTTLNTITLYISRTGTFAFIGTINFSEDAHHVRVYPNPYKPGSTGTFNASGITFDKLTVDATIKIYNLTGELIRELKETDTDGMITWDAKNAHGVDTVSGVYIAHIKGNNDEKLYKFAIER